MNYERFNRQIPLFGKEGQDKIKAAHVSIIGVGGLGSHVIQQLAFLGVGSLTMVDPDELDTSNLNRQIGVNCNDPIPGTKKVDIAKRLILSIDTSIGTTLIPDKLISKEAFSEIKKSTHVFGCVDNDGARLVLNELCAAFEIPYFDLATEIVINEGVNYGGRIVSSFDNNGCLYCYDLISIAEVNNDLPGSEIKKDLEKIYGIPKEHLENAGPSVISLNGIISSLAVTEFMVMVTGLRLPNRLLQYHSRWDGILTYNKDIPSHNKDCYYCKFIRGKCEKSDIDRYLKSP